MVLKLRTLSAMSLAVAIGLLPVLPPEHAHETEDHDGHHQLLMHRHASAHALRAEHHQDAALDHDDPLVTLEPVFTVAARVLLQPPVLPNIVVVGAPEDEPRTTLQDVTLQHHRDYSS